jgi:hypothetical protein
LIFIIARFETKPDYSERWPELVAPLTAATRAEEATSGSTGLAASITPRSTSSSRRSATATQAQHMSTVITSRPRCDLPQALASTPRIISQTIDATGWCETAEMKVN